MGTRFAPHSLPSGPLHKLCTSPEQSHLLRGQAVSGMWASPLTRNASTRFASRSAARSVTPPSCKAGTLMFSTDRKEIHLAVLCTFSLWPFRLLCSHLRVAFFSSGQCISVLIAACAVFPSNPACFVPVWQRTPEQEALDCIASHAAAPVDKPGRNSTVCVGQAVPSGVQPQRSDPQRLSWGF